MRGGELLARDPLTNPGVCQLHSMASLELEIGRQELEREWMLAVSWCLVGCRVRVQQSHRRIGKPAAVSMRSKKAF